jgi:hypothetical protein
MRPATVAAVVLLVACSGQEAAAPSPSPTVATPSPAPRMCMLPVWWEDGSDVHAAFVNIPNRTVIDAGIVPPRPQAGSTQLGGAYGGSWDVATRQWLRVDRKMLSPDGTHYVYWTATPLQDEVHLVEVATGADRVVYSGSYLLIPLSYEPDAIYLVHAINPRQSAFEHLFRLDLAGGTPTLVTGSDRHMSQYGWVLIAEGAAWGVGVSTSGSDYTYSIQRLDLATAQMTQWFESLNDLIWPLGVDANHALYVQSVGKNLLWRLAASGQADRMANPGPIAFGDYIAGPSGFLADSAGEWFAGRGGVWLYAEGAAPKQFVVGQPGGDVWPAGPCVLLPP